MKLIIKLHRFKYSNSHHTSGIINLEVSYFSLLFLNLTKIVQSNATPHSTHCTMGPGDIALTPDAMSLSMSDMFNENTNEIHLRKCVEISFYTCYIFFKLLVLNFGTGIQEKHIYLFSLMWTFSVISKQQCRTVVLNL